MSMNLLGLEVPQLVSLASEVSQHDEGFITTTSQLSSSAITPKFDPDDTMLMKINDKDCLDELEVSLKLMGNVPCGTWRRNNDSVTVCSCSKELPSPDVHDDVTALVIALDDPLNNDRLVKEAA